MDFTNWKWWNESRITVKDNEVVIYAPGHEDWFCDPVPDADGQPEKPVFGAPFYYTEVEGDFIISARVKPNHRSTYDACALMVIENEKLWTKLAFEASDFGTNAICCVVTNEVSDDGNGCDIAQDHVWLKIVRVGNVFSTHYSLDGENYHMVRLFRLPVPKKVKVGIEAQCPTGDGGERMFYDVKIEKRTAENLRKGQ